MVRGKLKLHFLQKPSARRITFNKRKKGVIKQAEALSTLCNVPVCAVIISPFDSTQTTWPSDSGVQDVLQRYINMPEDEQTKNETNMIEFNKKRLKKLEKRLKKQKLENKEDEINIRLNACLKEYENKEDADITDCLEGECSVGLMVRDLLKGESYFNNEDEALDEIEAVLERTMKEVDIRIKSLKGKNPENDEDR